MTLLSCSRKNVALYYCDCFALKKGAAWSKHKIGLGEKGGSFVRTARAPVVARKKLPKDEKRVFSRVECLVDLEVSSGDNCTNLPQNVEALDLSLLGLGFERSPADDSPPIGDTLTVGIHGFPSVKAKVRWVQGRRVGVQFCGRLHDIVDSWVGEVLAAQGVKVRDLFLVESKA